MPKVKTSLTSRNNDLFKKPYPIHVGAVNDSTPQLDESSSPLRMEKVLQTYMEAHKKTLLNVKETHHAIIKKAQQKSVEICEKDQECANLKQLLKTNQDEEKKLLATVKELKENADALQQNWQVLSDKFTHLEKDYDEKIHNANATIDLQKSKIEEQELCIAELQVESNNLQSSIKSLNAQLESNTEHYKAQINNLILEYESLQTQESNICKNLEALRQEMKVQMSGQEKLLLTISDLTLQLDQQQSTFDDLSNQHALQLNEEIANNELLQQKLADKDGELQVQLKQKQELSNDLTDLREKIELDSKAHIEEMEKLYKHNENVTRTYVNEETRYQLEIATLKEEIEEKHREQQEEINKLKAEIEELSKSNQDLQISKNNAIQELDNERAKYKEQLTLKENMYQSNLNDVQNELQRKHQELVQIERKKNADIAELKYKMNKIGNVFTQSVGSAMVFAESNQPKSVNSNQPVSGIIEPANASSPSSEAPSLTSDTAIKEEALYAVPVETPSSRPLRAAADRRILPFDCSDFNGETSEEEHKTLRYAATHAKLKRPHKNRSEKSKTRRINQTKPTGTSDMFDQLKMSNP